MSKRLQVVMDDAEYREIQDAAVGARLTVSAWVRQVLREARGPGAPAKDGVSRGAATTVSAEPGAEGPPTIGVPDPDPSLALRVMERYGLSTPGEALNFALRRTAEAPLSRGGLLELRGVGWSGDPRALRRGVKEG